MVTSTIAVFGNLMVDHIVIADRLPDLGEIYNANRYHKALSAKGANSAIAAYRSCHKKPREDEQMDADPESDPVDIQVRMIGAVGQDEYANFTSALKKNGINTSGICETKQTAMTFTMVEEDSRDNRILAVPGDALNAFSQEDFLSVEKLGNNMRPDLVISTLEIKTKVVEQMLETAGEAGVDFLLNAAPADNIQWDKYRFITHLLMNQSEAAILSGSDLEEVTKENCTKIVKQFLNLGAKNVVLTLGEHGAYYANKWRSRHVRAFNNNPVDQTGAG